MEVTPRALWIPLANTHNIYRGSPVEMLAEMAPNLGTREALRVLLAQLFKERGVSMTLPWTDSDEECARLFMKGLVDLGIAYPPAAA